MHFNAAFPHLRFSGMTLLLAALYFVTGKLGLMLAAPPGYATIIWPPSGIALGILLVHGARLWPGILLGSFLLNCEVAGLFHPGADIGLPAVASAFGIAVGSVLQALIGRALIARFIGLPLALHQFRDVLKLLVLACPVTCLIAASVGTGVLAISGTVATENIVSHWATWWFGDMFGIVIFLPLTLIAPGNPHALTWRGATLGTLPTIAMLVLLMPLALTLYGWKIASETTQRQGHAEFEALALESEKALLHRLDSYENALLGGEGFFQGSDFVSREEWRDYVDAVHLEQNFPGINGMGYAQPVASEQLPGFLAKIRSDHSPDFTIHPKTHGGPYFIITYIEPMEPNRQAIGLNIAFEEHRLEAAKRAMETGKPAITKRIVLVQDQEKTPGFLLLHPMYWHNKPLNTAQERADAFRGWIFAPFIAKHFLADLTKAQGYLFNLRIYDGTESTPDALIYQNVTSQDNKDSQLFTVRKTIDVMQQKWTVEWTSTVAYEQLSHSDNPLFILAGGLLFTVMFGLFLMVTSVQRAETMEWMGNEHNYILPIMIFVLLGGGAFSLFETLKSREMNYLRHQVEEEANKIELLLTSHIDDKLMALNRMAQRWNIVGGTPYKLWKHDAENYTRQLMGLKTVEWVDSAYHVQWVEPLKGNEHSIGVNIAFDEARLAQLKDAAAKETPVLTAPLELAQGYTAFIIYLPLLADERFDGFIAAIFSVHDFFSGILTRETKDNYALSISFEDRAYFTHTPDSPAREAWAVHKTIHIYDKEWELLLSPTEKLIENQGTLLPILVLLAGLMIAALSALTVRYVLLSRLKSSSLEQSNRLNAAILSSTAYLIVATDPKGKVITFNKAAEQALRYSAAEVVGKLTPAIWHDEEEVIARAHELSDELGEKVEPGFEVFIRKALIHDLESREWTFIRKNGSRFPVNVTVTPIRDKAGAVQGYLGVIEDITERKVQQQALQTSEETFRAAMEHASIGMALVGLDGHWLQVNEALCDLIGYTREELLQIDFQTITHPDDLEHDLEFVRQMLDGSLRTYQLEKRYFHKSGRIIWVLLSVSLVRDGADRPKYFISQIQDITERKEMERIKNEFISIVSHELRTPLTSIRGSLGLILGAFSADLSDKVKGLLDIAHSNCERLILLINDILDIDKIASGQMRFDMKEETLAAVTRQAVLANEAYAQKFGTHIELAPIDEQIRVSLDAARYIQVLSNLLSNAAKFTRDGKSISVFPTLIGDYVRISVRDQGTGIPEEFRSRIFGKFSQADSSVTRSKGGTGLGLHITKEIVEHMGGVIGFDTENGKGTTFWVQFPVLFTRPAPTPESTPESVFRPSASTSGLPAILHIEDDADLSNVLATALHGKAEIFTATSLRQAEAMLQKHRFALLVLDMSLPDGSGVHLLDRLSGLNAADVPVIILSADSPPVDVKERVAAVMIKSRVSEMKIVESIIGILENKF